MSAITSTRSPVTFQPVAISQVTPARPKEKPKPVRKPKAERPITDHLRPIDAPFRVLARSGRVLGDFFRLNDALDAYGRWAQASAVVIGTYVVIQREGGAAL